MPGPTESGTLSEMQVQVTFGVPRGSLKTLLEEQNPSGGVRLWCMSRTTEGGLPAFEKPRAQRLQVADPVRREFWHAMSKNRRFRKTLGWSNFADWGLLLQHATELTDSSAFWTFLSHAQVSRTTHPHRVPVANSALLAFSRRRRDRNVNRIHGPEGGERPVEVRRLSDHK